MAKLYCHIVTVINISIHDSVIHVTMFLRKTINTFDALTFIQMRTVLTDNKFTSGNYYTHKESRCM